MWVAVPCLAALWGLLPGAAGAQDLAEAPEVRLRFEAAEGESDLRLTIREAPSGVRPGESCKLPCEMSTVLGSYKLRIRRTGARRSVTNQASFYEDSTHRVVYRSRRVWRGLGGALLVAGVVVAGILWGAASRQAGSGLGGLHAAALGYTAAAIFGAGAIAGLALIFVPDRARLVQVEP
jgi:hypothetical protein